jgi:hypothetical protein
MKSLIKMMINGIEKIIDGHPDPKKNEVKFVNDRILVNGSCVGSGYYGIVEVVWQGPIAYVEATNIRIKSPVYGNVDGTNVTIEGSVTGNVDGVNVTCGDVIGGSIDATIVNQRSS